MFAKSEWKVLLDSEIARAVQELKTHEVNSPEYQKLLDGVSTLYRIKEEDKSRFGSKDTLAVIFGNLAGIFMIIKHEHVNVIGTKAMQLIRMPNARI